MNKLLIWVVLAVVIVAGLWLLFTYTQPAPAPSQAILKEVEGVDLGNLDQEFQEIDADLNSL